MWYQPETTNLTCGVCCTSIRGWLQTFQTQQTQASGSGCICSFPRPVFFGRMWMCPTQELWRPETSCDLNKSNHFKIVILFFNYPYISCVTELTFWLDICLSTNADTLSQTLTTSAWKIGKWNEVDAGNRTMSNREGGGNKTEKSQQFQEKKRLCHKLRGGGGGFVCWELERPV